MDVPVTKSNTNSKWIVEVIDKALSTLAEGNLSLVVQEEDLISLAAAWVAAKIKDSLKCAPASKS